MPDQSILEVDIVVNKAGIGAPDFPNGLKIGSTEIKGFASGTKMLFQQTSAPIGWTKETEHDNKALRVVNGTAGSGGSVGFTAAFASHTPSGSVTVNNKALNSTSLMPSHRHSAAVYSYASHTSGLHGVGHQVSRQGSAYSNYEGGNGNHNHGASFSGTAMNLSVNYVDIIIATRD